jgi:hypothetical protein
MNRAYSNFPSDLCLIASPNIPSNSKATLPGIKLKISLEMYLPDLVYLLPNPNEINTFNCEGAHKLMYNFRGCGVSKLDKSWLTDIIMSVLCTNLKPRTWDALPTLVS